VTEKDPISTDSPRKPPPVSTPTKPPRSPRTPRARKEPSPPKDLGPGPTANLLIRTSVAPEAAESGRTPLPRVEYRVGEVTGLTDHTGERSVSLPPGEHQVTVIPPSGYDPPAEHLVRLPGGDPRAVPPDAAVLLQHEQTTEVEVILIRQFEVARKTGTVVGTVLDADGNAIRLVRLVLGHAGGGGKLAFADTDWNGRFVFHHVRPGRYTVRLDEVPAVVNGVAWQPIPPDNGERWVEVDDDYGEVSADPIVLEPVPIAGAITGFVVDVGTAQGVMGVQVGLLPAGAALPVATGSGGRFTFSNLAPGSYTVRLTQPPAGYRLHPPDSGQRPVVITSGQSLEVTPILLEAVPVVPTGTIHGWVRDAQDGNGVGGIGVVAELVGGGPRHQTTTAPVSGSFTIPALPPGDYCLGLQEDPAGDGDGRLWQPQPPDKGDRNVTVTAARVDVAPILVEPVSSSVTGEVRRVTDRTPIAGVEMILRATDGVGDPLTAATTGTGEFEFLDVRPGPYVLALAKDPVIVGNDRMEPIVTDRDRGRRAVQVPVNARVAVQPILLEPERHRISGTVRTSPGGPGIPFAELRILDGRGNPLATVQADRKGEYEYRADRPGRYLVEVVRDGVRHVDTVDLQSDFILDPVPGGAAAGTQLAPSGDFAAFPVLTEAVTLPQLPASGAGPSSSVGQTVEAALREALGWRPRANDPRGFSAALVHSFDRREIEGHTMATWTPRSYAAQVQADLGAITGAQASLYSRSRVALDAALPLLDGLYPLDPAADPQDTEAIRTIVRSELNELVAELGVEGGPRLSRVDDLLDQLLGTLQKRVPGEVGGQLKLLQDRFGLVSARVDTVEEEENLTNFLILVDYVREIDTSWRAQRGFFDPTNPTATPFLGTQLVLLSRSLAVVAESVTEVGFTLDSVFIGAAERLAIRLRFDGAGSDGTALVDSRNQDLPVPADTPSILLGELLSWVERVASEEGPRLLQDAGKDGATALTPVLDKLRRLVRASLVNTGSGANRGLQSPGSVPAGYATARVQRALAELAGYLDDTTVLASRIQR